MRARGPPPAPGDADGLAHVIPGISLASLVLLFGAYCLADGLMAAWTAIWHRRQTKNVFGLLLVPLALQVRGAARRIEARLV